jgi:ArsR family transcriptional regulator
VSYLPILDEITTIIPSITRRKIEQTYYFVILRNTILALIRNFAKLRIKVLLTMINTMSDAYQALSSPVRRKILALLKEKDLSAGEISEEIAVAKSTLSGHFNVLKSADLVITIKEGTTIIYSLNTSVVEDLMNGLFNLFEKKSGKSECKESL